MEVCRAKTEEKHCKRADIGNRVNDYEVGREKSAKLAAATETFARKRGGERERGASEAMVGIWPAEGTSALKTGVDMYCK